MNKHNLTKLAELTKCNFTEKEWNILELRNAFFCHCEEGVATTDEAISCMIKPHSRLLRREYTPRNDNFSVFRNSREYIRRNKQI